MQPYGLHSGPPVGTISFALGWRTRGGPRRWQRNHFDSLDHAAAVARDLARSDGGGRWRVYSTRLDIAEDGVAREVLDRVLAEGVVRSFAAPGGGR